MGIKTLYFSSFLFFQVAISNILPPPCWKKELFKETVDKKNICVKLTQKEISLSIPILEVQNTNKILKLWLNLQKK